MDANEILYGRHRRREASPVKVGIDPFEWARSSPAALADWCWRHPEPLLKSISEQEYSFALIGGQLRLLTPRHGDDKLILHYRRQPGGPAMTVFIDPLDYLRSFDPGELEQLRAYIGQARGGPHATTRAGPTRHASA